MKKHWMFFLLVALTMTACEKAEEPAENDFDQPAAGVLSRESLVSSYFEPNALVLDARKNELGPYVRFSFEGEGFAFDTSNPEKRARYNEYVAKYDDRHFNDSTLPIGASGEAITTVRVTSTADFDPAHPAGTLLNDLVRIKTYTYYPFLCYLRPNSGLDLCAVRSEIYKLLSELTPEEMILWEGTGYFELTTTPDPALEELPLRVEFDFENGRTITAEVNFEL